MNGITNSLCVCVQWLTTCCTRAISLLASQLFARPVSSGLISLVLRHSNILGAWFFRKCTCWNAPRKFDGQFATSTIPGLHFSRSDDVHESSPRQTGMLNVICVLSCVGAVRTIYNATKIRFGLPTGTFLLACEFPAVQPSGLRLASLSLKHKRPTRYAFIPHANCKRSTTKSLDFHSSAINDVFQALHCTSRTGFPSERYGLFIA